MEEFVEKDIAFLGFRKQLVITDWSDVVKVEGSDERVMR